MTHLVSIVQGLYCHDAGVDDARPDRERDQAAMLGWIARGSNEKGTKDGVDPADHLQVVLTMPSVPLPSRRPKETHRIDGEEDCTDGNQGNLEELFTRDIVHAGPPAHWHLANWCGI